MSIETFLPAEYEYKHAASTSGGELAGPCPWCGGRDRFRVWPETGRYWCRQCGAQGDEIQLLRDLHGLTFAEACERAGKPVPERRTSPRPQSGSTARWTPKEEGLPSPAWMARARAFLDACEPGGEHAAARGVTSGMVRWNPTDQWQDREAWGLSPEANPKTGKPKRVWLPAGLVIPTWRKAGVVALKIRRAAWTPEDTFPKYAFVVGGVVAPMVLGAVGQPVVVVESELDAILIHQEAGDLVCAVALGSASNKRDAKTADLLNAAPVVLVALDFDNAGAEAWGWWRKTFPSARRWAPLAKDIGDMDLALVRPWTQAGLPVSRPEGPSAVFSDRRQGASRSRAVNASRSKARASDVLPSPPEDASLELLALCAMVQEWGIRVALAPAKGLEVNYPPGLRPELRRVFLDGLDRCGEQLEALLDRRSRGRWAQ